ncbi:MAG: ATP synthase F1 subunit delta [Chloroflexi bacterium]|nr:ATP synthase F1 subunit delta [Chloroflexota bacterium]
MPAPRDIAGRRYALALVAIARDDQTFDAWLDAVQALEALTAQRAYVQALQGDGMTDGRFQAIVRRVFPSVGTKQMNFLRLLRRKGRLGLGSSIASFYRELYDAERGVLRAEVTSAVPLDDGQRQRLQEKIARDTGKQVELEARVDAAIMGGMVVRIGDRLVDGSTRTRLRSLRTQLERVAR